MIDCRPGGETQASCIARGSRVAGWLHVLGGQLCWRGEAGALLQCVGARAPPCWVTLRVMKWALVSPATRAP